MTHYTGSRLNNCFTIEKLYSVHYFEYGSNFRFSGESHDFWEFVYADKGEFVVTAGDKDITLNQGNIIFHKPNEWHNIYSNGVIAPNVAIVSFSCNSPEIKFFENKILKVSRLQKEIISKIINEYTNIFSTPLNNPYSNKLIKKQNIPIASEQLLKMYICELLISFIRTDTSVKERPLIAVPKENSLLNLVLNYMRDNINRPVTVNELVRYSGSNRTTITKLFNDNFKTGVIEYFINMKIDASKTYLRENHYNVTQVSEILGFSSVHYFTRCFKLKEGMTPTEYIRSIKSLNIHL